LPADDPGAVRSQPLSVEQAIEALEELRRTHSLGDVSLTELIESGRI